MRIWHTAPPTITAGRRVGRHSRVITLMFAANGCRVRCNIRLITFVPYERSSG